MRRAIAAAVLVAAGGVVGCSGGSGDDDPADVLAGQVSDALAGDPGAVVDRLAELGIDAEADDVTEADLTCPVVREPAAGDRATCTAEIGGAEVAVVVEFADDGAVTVIGVEAQP